jgi:uncharacterized repeat protein (TIGR03803 family)
MPATPRRSPRRFLSWLTVVLAFAQSPVWAQDEDPAVSVVLALSGSRTLGGVVRGPDGDLYGAASVTVGGQAGGLIFKVEPDGENVRTLYQLGEGDGVGPQTGLLLGSDEILYGTTHFGLRETDGGLGTVFSIRPDGSDFTTLHIFADDDGTNQDDNPTNEDGAFPDAALIEGTVQGTDGLQSDGFLYGVTRSGGENGTGTVFRIALDGTLFKTLHEFGEITSEDDDPLTKNADGAYPLGTLVARNGYLYGTTSRGGANGRGTVFRLKKNGSEFQVLHIFTNITDEDDDDDTVPTNEDGAAPLAGLLYVEEDGLLYGVTSVGGENGTGTVFSITPAGSELTEFNTLHDFGTKLGSQPAATPILGDDGLLYGTTSSGGTNQEGDTTSFGTIWSMPRDGTPFRKIFSFDGTTGSGPNSAMLQLNSSIFVGTTGGGGRCGEGTVFRLDLTGDTIEGDTTCGDTGGGNSGGGRIDPAWLLVLGLLGWWSVARRRTIA